MLTRRQIETLYGHDVEETVRTVAVWLTNCQRINWSLEGTGNGCADCPAYYIDPEREPDDEGCRAWDWLHGVGEL